MDGADNAAGTHQRGEAMSAINEVAAQREALFMLCGEKLGHGSGREVYSCSCNPGWVIKIETNGGSFQNVIEWDTWSWAKTLPQRKWFAPCYYISPSGVVMLQAKTETARRHTLPTKMPAFMSDFKLENFGWIGKQFVCHDYGISWAARRGMSSAMKRVMWR